MKETGFSRVSKNLIIRDIEKELKQRPAFFIAQHGSVPATSLDRLRVKLRSAGARYLVVKNSLCRVAFDRAKLKDFSSSVSGSCGIAFTSGDGVASSKILVEFAKENEAFKIQRGFLNGEAVPAEKIKILASLPSREVLLTQLVTGLQSPVSRFVGVLSGSLRKVVTVLDALAKKKGPAA
jgi:large subunit ribosomal protein L10